MKDEEVKIRQGKYKVVPLKELYEGKSASRKAIARFPFKKKIEMLISLQETACTWGGIKDIIVWKRDSR